MAAAALIGLTGLLAGKAISGMSSKASDATALTGTVSPTAAQTVDATSSATSQNNARGRAALISTSASGVLGTDPTGRRKILGN